MAVILRLTGEKEIDKVLRGLPLQVNHKVLQAAHTSAARVLVTAEKLSAPEGPTGKLIDSIGVIKTPLRRAGELGEIHVGARRGRYKGHAAHLVEYGFKTRVTHGRYGKKTRVAGKPFARPSWEKTKGKVQASIADHLGRHVLRYMKRTIKKYG